MVDNLKTAQGLESLVVKAMRDFEFAMNVINLPPSVRQPMWLALGRRSIAKAEECRDG